MTNGFLQRALYEVLYNNLLLPRIHEIDREEEEDVFDGTTESLVRLYRDSQISYEQFSKLPESEIMGIIEKSKDLPICKERFFALGIYKKWNVSMKQLNHTAEKQLL